MGIDRHELEHRNWRSSATAKTSDNSGEVAQESGLSIVPDDSVLADSNVKAAPAKPRASRAKAH